MGDEIARVTLMATDGHPTWDLSPKDCAALRALLARLRDAERELAEARAPYGWRKPVPEDVHARVVRERDEARAAQVIAEEAAQGAGQANAEYQARAESAEARVAELESEQTKLRVDPSRAWWRYASWHLDRKELTQLRAAHADLIRTYAEVTDRMLVAEHDVAQLRAIADAVGAFEHMHPLTWEMAEHLGWPRMKWDALVALRAALAARVSR